MLTGFDGNQFSAKKLPEAEANKANLSLLQVNRFEQIIFNLVINATLSAQHRNFIMETCPAKNETDTAFSCSANVA